MSIKTILAGSAAALALTGDIAYAATTASPASPAPAVTSTVTTTATTQPAGQNPATWPAATCPRHGNDCCRYGYGYQGSGNYGPGYSGWCCGNGCQH